MDFEKYDLSLFQSGLKALGLELSDFQLEQFMQYYTLLMEWNSFQESNSFLAFESLNL